MKNMGGKRLLQGTFTLVGATIGAGILGLPYIFSKSGFLIGLFWIISIGILMLFVHLYLGEIILRTNGNHQLTGYAEKYLGKYGKFLMLFAMVFGIYSALVAYLIGEGQSISYVISGSGNYTIFFGFLFWAIMTLLLREGLRGLKKVELYGVFFVLTFILGIFFYFFPQINTQNLFYNNLDLFFVPIGIILFSLLGFSAIPEVGRIMEYSKKEMKKALIIGTVIPIIAYILFAFSFVGAFGMNLNEVATLSSGRLIALLGIFTMTTSFFVLSFALKDMFSTDLKIKRRNLFILVSVIPLLLYLFITFFNLLDFSKVLGIGGVISGGLIGILILLMNYNAKKYGERRPEYWISINWLIILLVSLMFMGAMIVELVL